MTTTTGTKAKEAPASAGRDGKEGSACCAPEAKASCCAPSEKADCCRETESTGRCGCR